MAQEEKVDQNHLMYPQVSVMAGATQGGRSKPRPSYGKFFRDEHLEVETRFPFSPSGFGALRDVAYFGGVFVLRSGQVQDGSHVSESERASE